MKESNIVMYPNKIFVWGMMGVGKSTVGRKLAKKLDWKFYDLDEQIVKRTGESIEDIFEMQGESGFRTIESDVLTDLIQDIDVVISTGGGTPCFNDNDHLMLTSGICVWLDAPPKFLQSRVKNSMQIRPLLRGLNDEEQIQVLNYLLAKRTCYYEQAALKVSAKNFDQKNLTEQLLPLFKNNPRFIIKD